MWTPLFWSHKREHKNKLPQGYLATEVLKRYKTLEIN